MAIQSVYEPVYYFTKTCSPEYSNSKSKNNMQVADEQLIIKNKLGPFGGSFYPTTM